MAALSYFLIATLLMCLVEAKYIRVRTPNRNLVKRVSNSKFDMKNT